MRNESHSQESYGQESHDQESRGIEITDPTTSKELEALRQAMMRSWWLICLGIWLTVGLGCLWWIRRDIVEISEYFTWAAVRSIFLYQRPAGMGLAFCIGLTFALLLSESRQILWGISKDEQARLMVNLEKIHAQGPSHPQWELIHKSAIH
ncbi:MAG: hypothetical protein AAFU53_03315 [Cyanobacteria bacterium J06632_3]